MRPDRERTAHHEAGHAVAATVLGIQVEYLALAGYEDPEHRGTHSGIMYYLPSGEGADLALRVGLMALSGPEAGRRYVDACRSEQTREAASRWWGRFAMDRREWDGDILQALELPGASMREDRWWSTLCWPTIALMDSWWPFVVPVARQLLRTGRLEGGEAVALMEAVPGWDVAKAMAEMHVRRLRCEWLSSHCPEVDVSHGLHHGPRAAAAG